jgi:hypothetical protein
MADWAGILVEDVDKAESGLARAIGLSSELGAQEFEEVIGSFLNWQAALGLTERFKTIGGPDPISMYGEVELWIGNSRRRAAAFTEALRTSLYREFGREAIDAPAAAQAHSALRSLLASAGSFVYATTNYDVCIEVGLKQSGINVNDGFNPAPMAAPELSLDDMIDWDSDHGGRQPVLHLHGAVGWYRMADGKIIRHYANLPYNPTLGVPVILPPDPNKDPVSDSSVSLIWDRFRTALRGATHVLVIGHSLHDAPLVGVLREALAHAHMAVTYFRREPSRDEAVTEATRVRSHFPGRDVMVLPMSFAPHLEYDSDAVMQWLGREPTNESV